MPAGGSVIDLNPLQASNTDLETDSYCTKIQYLVVLFPNL